MTDPGWLIPTASAVVSVAIMGGTALWKSSAWVAIIGSKIEHLEGKVDGYASRVNGDLDELRDIHRGCVNDRLQVENSHGERLAALEAKPRNKGT